MGKSQALLVGISSSYLGILASIWEPSLLTMPAELTVCRNSTKNQMAYFSGNFLQYESLSASHGHLEKYVC